MKIIVRNSDNVVLFAGQDLQLDESLAQGDGWEAKFLNNTNARIEIADLPDNFINGGWTYDNETFTRNSVGDAHVAELAAASVPQEVEMRQAQLALLDAGLLSNVEAFIATQTEEAQIFWNKSLTIRRDFVMVAATQAALGLTDAQIDGLFIAAALKV